MSFNTVFTYEPATGRLLWSVTKPGRGCVAGREAGTVRSDGRYRTVFVDGYRRYCHRIVWEMAFGPIPDGLCIDHINGNGLDNRLSNLRLVTLSGNQRNAKLPRNNRYGIQGIYQKKNGFSVRCGSAHVGWFKDFFEACCARKSAEFANSYHPNHGRK